MHTLSLLGKGASGGLQRAPEIIGNLPSSWSHPLAREACMVAACMSAHVLFDYLTGFDNRCGVRHMHS